MPRIPQGQFRDTSNNEVPRGQARIPDSGVGAVLQASTGLMGAMAQLQDQTERTEAFTYANNVKQKFLGKKAVYEEALKTTNGQGVANYFDPTDQNPDISKRRRITRPLGELYKEMVDEYEEDKKGNTLTRGDIASEIMQNQVGDQLINMQMDANKHINRVRETEVRSQINDDMVLGFENTVTMATQPDASPTLVAASIAKLKNSATRQLAMSGDVLGVKGVEEVNKLYDRSAGAAARQIISSGVSATTVSAADAFVKSIRDPKQRLAAAVSLENVKKSTSTITNRTLANKAVDMGRAVNASTILDDSSYQQVAQHAGSLFNAFIDPKYSSVKREEMDKAGVDLVSTALAKRLMQDNLYNALDFLDDGEIEGRSPSGDASKKTSRQEFEDRIATEIEASGLKGMMRGDEGLAASVRDMAMQKVRQNRTGLQDNLFSMIKSQNPDMKGRELMEKFKLAAETHRLGDPKLMGSREAKVFQQQMIEQVTVDPMGAMNLMNQHLMDAGDSYEGEDSYRLRMAGDMVGKNPKLAFVLPASIMDVPDQYQMMEDASRYTTRLKEAGASSGELHSAFASTQIRTGLLELEGSNPIMYEGIKQAVLHEAARSIRSKSDVKSAVQDVAKKYQEKFQVIKVAEGSHIMAFSRGGGTNYNTSEAKTNLKKGAEFSRTMPQLNRAQKIELIDSYVGGRGLTKIGTNVTTPDEHIDFLLKAAVKLRPDGKYPNEQEYTINGVPIAIKGKIQKVSSEDIMNYGSALRGSGTGEATKPPTSMMGKW